jgi:hypothetical protein
MATLPALDADRLDAFAKELSGSTFQPGEAGYDEARAVHNGLIDKRPALIVRCRGVADVTAAIRLARETGHEISVRGGGHNIAGRCVTNGGIMVDLAEMKGSKGARRTGLVRVQPRSGGSRTCGYRRCDLDDRHSRSYARWRPRLANGNSRPRRRQPSLRRTCQG